MRFESIDVGLFESFQLSRCGQARHSFPGPVWERPANCRVLKARSMSHVVAPLATSIRFHVTALYAPSCLNPLLRPLVSKSSVAPPRPQHYGFEFKEESQHTCHYTQNPDSMMHTVYYCPFFVAIKKPSLPKFN